MVAELFQENREKRLLVGAVQNKEAFPDFFAFLEKARDWGSRWVEFKYERELDPGGRMRNLAGEDLGRLAEKYGIPVSVHAPYNPGINFGALDREIRTETRERMKACLDFASRVKARYITLHGGYLTIEAESLPEETGSGQPPYLLIRQRIPGEEFENLKQRIFTELRLFMAQAAARGIPVALENLHGFSDVKARFPITPEDYNECRVKLGEGVCLVYDTGHGNSTGLHIMDYINRVGAGRIAGAHIHDNEGNEDQHLPPGKGNIDFPAFFSYYLSNGLSFPLNLEMRSEKDFELSRFSIRDLLADHI